MAVDPIKKNNVKISGNPNATQTIVFAHGFGTDHTAWRFIMPAFLDKYRTVTFDNVGAAESTAQYFAQSKYARLESYANDLVDICDELELKDALYIGASVSGMVGLLASKQRPEMFSHLIFLNASPRYLNQNDYVGGFEKQDLVELYRLMATNYHNWAKGFSAAVMKNAEKPQLADEFARTLSAIRPDIAVAVAKAIFESDYRKEIEGFDKATLIIQSKNDIAVPVDVGMFINEKLPNSKLSIIPAEGHFPHISVPDLVVEEIKSFIAA